MPGDDEHPPGVTTLLTRLVRTGLGALHNRAELLAVEWEEERARLAEMMAWAAVMLFLAMVGVILVTAAIIFLFPPEWRLYVMIGLALLYFIGAVAAWFNLKSALRREPFAESFDQIKKDRLWLDSFR